MLFVEHASEQEISISVIVKYMHILELSRLVCLGRLINFFSARGAIKFAGLWLARGAGKSVPRLTLWAEAQEYARLL